MRIRSFAIVGALASALALPLAVAAADRALVVPTLVGGLTAEGTTALVAVPWASPERCERVIAWRPARGTQVALGPRRPCPRARRGFTSFAIVAGAIAGRRVAWAGLVGDDPRAARLYTTMLRTPRSAVRIPIARGEYLGSVRGDGSLLVFSTFSCARVDEAWKVRSCGLGGRPELIVETRIWRLIGAKKELVARAAGPLALVDVSAGRILVRRADGSLATLSAKGKTLATLEPRPGSVSAALGGRHVAVLVREPRTSPDNPLYPLRVDVYDAASGAFLRAWPVGSSCACGPGQLGARMVGVERGVAAFYSTGSTLHVLRLADGRIARFENRSYPVIDLDGGEASGRHADLEPNGLFYTSRRSEVTFVPFREIRFS